PRLRALRDARRRIEWPRGDHARPRLVHGVVSTLRLRPRRLRAAVYREARPVRCSAYRAAVLVGRIGASAARACGGLPEDDLRRAPRLDRRRRLAGVGAARGALPIWTDARDHRWRSGPVRAVRRALPALALRARRAPSSRRRALPRLRRRHRRGRCRAPLSVLQGAAGPDRSRAWVAADHPPPVRRGGRYRSRLRWLAGDRRREDRPDGAFAGSRSLRSQVLERRAAARAPAALDRALRHRSDPSRAGAARADLIRPNARELRIQLRHHLTR